jgi:hypothetical protein
MGATIDTMRELLDHAFRVGSFTMPAALHLGLSRTPIGEDGGGITEPSGGSYARVDVSAGIWSAASNANPTQVTNGAVIDFGTASADWGTVTHWFLSTASSGGTVRWSGRLKDAYPIASGDEVVIAAGDIVATWQALP